MEDYLKDSSAPILLDQSFSNFFFNNRILVQTMSFLEAQGQRMGCEEGMGILIPLLMVPPERSLKTIDRSSNTRPKTAGQRSTHRLDGGPP